MVQVKIVLFHSKPRLIVANSGQQGGLAFYEDRSGWTSFFYLVNQRFRRAPQHCTWLHPSQTVLSHCPWKIFVATALIWFKLVSVTKICNVCTSLSSFLPMHWNSELNLWESIFVSICQISEIYSSISKDWLAHQVVSQTRMFIKTWKLLCMIIIGDGLRNFTGLFGNFLNMGGGLPNSQDFSKLTKYFFYMPNSFWGAKTCFIKGGWWYLINFIA